MALLKRALFMSKQKKKEDALRERQREDALRVQQERAPLLLAPSGLAALVWRACDAVVLVGTPCCVTMCRWRRAKSVLLRQTA